MRFVLTALVASLSLALCACSSGHKTTTIANGNGTTTTVDTSNGSGNGTVTVNSKEGTTTAGQNAVDPSKIGMPVYPGATTAGGGGWSVQSKEGTGQMVSLTTNDSFVKVEGWYKSQFPAGSEVMNISSGNTSSAVFQVGKAADADQKSIEITSDGTKTTIVLSHKTTAPSSNAP